MRLRLPEEPVVFRGCDALAWGDLRRAELEGPGFQRVLRSVYAPAAAPRDHALLCAATGLLAPPSAMITGASAATLLGMPWLGARDDVELVLPEGVSPPRVRGLRARRSTQALRPGRRWATTQVADPVRVAFDAAARLPLPVAVARLDALLGAGLTSVDALRTHLDGTGANDVVQVRRALDLVDVRAESLPESELRVHLALAGLDVVPQHVVRHDGRLVARVDLALVEEQVAVEYDGAWHALREQLERDRQRLDGLAAARWAVVHVTAPDLRDPRRVVALVRAAVERQRSVGIGVSTRSPTPRGGRRGAHLS